MALRKRVRHVIGIGVVAVAMVVVATSPAAADPFEPSSWTVVPGGPYSVSGPVQFGVAASFLMTCDSAMSGTFTSGPGVTNPLGTVETLGFSNCTGGPLGDVTATVNEPPYDIIGSTYDQYAEGVSGVPETTGYIGHFGLHISMTVCEFDLVGNVPFTFDNDTGDWRVGGEGPLPAGVAALHVINVSGCLGLVNDGDPGVYLAGYLLNQMITGQP
ncbi:MAG: hypothetical protein GEV28_30710 [Actinophytocola sp.]|uniref:hypothetical protein n=1 Tax=Actinophytocola sp. TaxID=1872138 RepID=UPI001321F71C|nr:hypothetical protein [Actinophytocola sp.]MPZ84524.1 hypothetical protein [Actinophytocola sp.]